MIANTFESELRPSTRVRSELAQKSRRAFGSDAVELAALRVEFRACRAAEYLRKVVDEAPSLTADQLTALQRILSTAHDDVLDATGLADAGEQ